MMKPREMVFRVLVFSLLVSACAFTLRASAPIGAVVQTWHDDPVTNSVTLKILNTPYKGITAFNIAIKETYANGRVDKHEMLEDLVGKIIAAKEIEAGDHSRGAELFRKLYGDGALHPGEVHDEIIGVQPGFQTIDAVVDVVAYVDGTADAANNDALGRIVEERQATVTYPATTAATKIQDRVTIWKAQQHSKLDLDVVRLESVANEIKTVSSHNVNQRDALKQIANTEEARMSVLSVHVALAKTGGSR